MKSQSNKQNMFVHFFRRKGYTIIFLVFALLVISQIKHLLNISNLIENIPAGNMYMDINNNTTFDSQLPESGDAIIYIIAGEVGLNVRTHASRTSPLVASLPPGSVVVSAPRTFQSESPPRVVSIAYPVKGWVSSVTLHSRLVPANSFLPSCRPETFLPGVKYTLSTPAPPPPMPRSARGGRERMPPPPAFGSPLPHSESKLPKFVSAVNTSVDCCYICAGSPTCGGWTFISGGMCLMREAGQPYRTATGLPF
jgi:hypothetical protein